MSTTPPDPESLKPVPHKLRWWEFILTVLMVLALWNFVFDFFTKKTNAERDRAAAAAEEGGRDAARQVKKVIQGKP